MYLEARRSLKREYTISPCQVRLISIHIYPGTYFHLCAWEFEIMILFYLKQLLVVTETGSAG